MKEYDGKKITIMACSNCNVNCKHCYISYKGNRDPDELLEIVKSLKDRYQLNINGAENLTNINYLKSYKEIGQHYLMSNGLLIYQNPQIIDKLIENDIYSVSLSYHFGIQDNISQISTQCVEKVIEMLLNSGLQVRLFTTVTKNNYKLINDICDKAYSLGVRGIKFTNYIRQGNAIQLTESNILNDKEKYEFFKQLDSARKKYDIEKFLIQRCGSFGKDLYKGESNFKCDMMCNSVVLTPDNKIYPCIFLAKPGYEVGIYENGRIMVDDFIQNDGSICYVDEICNKNNDIKIFSKKL